MSRPRVWASARDRDAPRVVAASSDGRGEALEVTAPEQAHEQHTTSAGSQHSITVVIADDTPELLAALTDLISDEPGLDVVAVATTGTEAVEAVLRIRPDVTVMDMRMPELDGIRAARQILGAWPEAQVVMHSAYDDQSLVDEALAVGVAGYVVKSRGPFELIDCLLSFGMDSTTP